MKVAPPVSPGNPGSGERRVAPGPSTMHCSLWRCIIVAVSLVLLGFIFQENKEEHVEYRVSVKEKKEVIWKAVQEQISSERKNHLETFKEMQQRAPLLQHAKYRFLAGAPPQQKKLLTVGISSMQPPGGSHLLDTLRSVFEASSEPEWRSIVVLVHLSDPDPEWLNQTATNISRLFAPHIEARELLVIHGLLGGSPVPGNLSDTNHTSPCEALYSKQKVDYALLMNFASSLSDYFLLMEDHVHCSPKFVSAIYWALSAWEELPWVTLEFSSLNMSGKVFRSSDLSRLTSFFLLFLNTPAPLLLSEFRLLLAQDVPIRFTPSLFSHVGVSSTVEDSCFPVEKEQDFDEPDNPTATVVTDMEVFLDLISQYAYTLNQEDFSTLDLLKGNHLTVIMDRPQKVIRIAVLTGLNEGERYRLQQGQVELGYDPIEEPKGCAHYTLLGPLVQGNLDQRVFSEEDSEKVSCIRLLVLASQKGWVLIRQIRVWTQPEEEES
ncbi:alpha-1,3-mannosyl-glycoprotein 4-beta-N-acetylglucosaminyltransferase-like protein MGAT4E [Microcebus murinus]|uniref:alpha-1,3-mannosyl-glycoprotein 4-beta-N-acetylglucosaminyltransferase-like protein MGAT4E n=1 Tax=Microcebus murinus TaxID=30608 RepID=UPI003F6D3618